MKIKGLTVEEAAAAIGQGYRVEDTEGDTYPTVIGGGGFEIELGTEYEPYTVLPPEEYEVGKVYSVEWKEDAKAKGYYVTAPGEPYTYFEVVGAKPKQLTFEETL